MSRPRLPERFDAAPAVNVQEAEYVRLLGYPRGYVLEDRARELADQARAWYARHGRPWWYARQVDSFSLGAGGGVTLDGASFTSRRLHDQLLEAGADSAVLVAVSAGPECEARSRELWDAELPDEYFFLEILGSAVVEALVAAASYQLCEWADGHQAAVLPHYSPGYVEWDIAEQGRLFHLLAGGTGGLPGALDVLDTGMLAPKKSLLAVFGLTPHLDRVQRLTALVPCSNCSLPGCRYRRAPYHKARPPLEEVPAAAAPAVSYSLGAGVLDKWSRERLRLERSNGGTVTAHFRYDGTTCSNMGQPLAFEYRVALAPGPSGYTIREAHCEPAPGDTGHTRMCEYLTDPDGLMARIAAEQPLVGRPLDDVLGWERPRYPAGCYCTEMSRQHKWGIVLEVLHYAMTKRGGAGPA